VEPFRTSLSARIVSLAVSAALIGGGVIALAGLDPAHVTPWLLMACITATIAGLILGVYDHPAEVLLVGMLAPMALFPYVMALDWVIRSAPHLGLLLVGVGLVPLALTTMARATIRQPASQPAPA
jgi:hypothetical protein